MSIPEVKLAYREASVAKIVELAKLTNNYNGSYIVGNELVQEQAIIQAKTF